MRNGSSSGRSRLYLFTDSFPWGTGETFLESELPYLCERFPEVHIIARRPAAGILPPRDVPHGVTVEKPVFPRAGRWAEFWWGVRGRAPWKVLLRDAWKNRVFASLLKLANWVETVCVVRALHRHELFPRFSTDESSLLYFYWGVGCAWALPFLSPRVNAVVRYHGHDVYEDRQGYRGYMPLRTAQLRRPATLHVTISGHGERYLRRLYPDIDFESACYPLGVEDAGRAPFRPDDVFRITSCSRMVGLKRLDLLMDALARLDFPVHWTHIGDGPQRASLERKREQLPSHVAVTWLGAMDNVSVREHYAGTCYDLFVNVSETEGLPVTVMEALSAGIPVMATEAGGTAELVDDEVGWLLPVNLSAAELADALNTAARERDRPGMREAARRRWHDRADAVRNFNRFGDRLTSL